MARHFVRVMTEIRNVAEPGRHRWYDACIPRRKSALRRTRSPRLEDVPRSLFAI